MGLCSLTELMTIAANSPRIVRYLILMATDTNFSSGYLPFVRNMAAGAVRGCVGRLKMQLGSGRMTGHAGGNGLEALLFLVALGAGKSHRRIGWTHVTRGTFRDKTSPPP